MCGIFDEGDLYIKCLYRTPNFHKVCIVVYFFEFFYHTVQHGAKRPGRCVVGMTQLCRDKWRLEHGIIML